MCTWAVCWLMSKKDIPKAFLGWAIFADIWIFTTLFSDAIKINFGE